MEDVNKVVNQCRCLIATGKQFAVLIPVSIAGETVRLENSDGDRHYDEELLKKVEGLSKITWRKMQKCGFLISPITELTNSFLFTSKGQTRLKARKSFNGSFDRFKNDKANQLTLDDDHTQVANADPNPCPVMLSITRSRRNVTSGEQNSSIHTPAANLVLGESQAGFTSDEQIAPVIR